jgi:hypothetical protein
VVGRQKKRQRWPISEVTQEVDEAGTTGHMGIHLPPHFILQSMVCHMTILEALGLRMVMQGELLSFSDLLVIDN